MPPRPSQPQSQSPHTAYNPQNYAQQSHSPPQQFTPYSPYPPPAAPQGSQRPPQPYNPAAYHDNSIASAANHIYGPATAQYPPNVSSYAPRPPTQPSSPNVAHGFPPASPHQQQYPRMSPGSSYQTAHRYNNSAPLPSRPYPGPSHAQAPPPVPPLPYYADSSYNQQSYGQHTYPQPGRFASPSQHSPSPDFHSQQTPPNHQRNDSTLHMTSAFPRPPGQPPISMPTAEPHVQDIERHVSTRHPHSRPLPGPPSHGTQYLDDSDDSRTYEDSGDDAQREQDALFDQLESDLTSGSFATYQPAQVAYTQQAVPTNESQHLNVNGYENPPNSAGLRTHWGDLGDEDEEEGSDMEAAAGLEAMRMAEEQEEGERQRSRSSSHLVNGSGQEDGVDEHDVETVDDYADGFGVDLSAFGGGFDVPMSYGGPTSPTANLSAQHPSMSSTHTARTDQSGQTVTTSRQTSLTTPSIYSHGPPAGARVDESGTGGLADPSALGRKLSFDTDDPSERAWSMQQAQQAQQAQQQQGAIPGTHQVPETYYQHPTNASRPLPSIPANQTLDSSGYEYPSNPSSYAQHSAVQANNVPRSHSMNHPATTQQTVPPARAKTDAEDRKRASYLRLQATGDTAAHPVPHGTHLGPDLPSLPTGKRVQPSKIRQSDYDRCEEPWALSSIVRWLRSMAEGDPELKEHTIEEILVNLFLNKVSTLNIPLAEDLSRSTLATLYSAKTLIHDEEWLRFGPGEVTGVLYQLTGKGCYSRRVHESEGSGRCYSHHCQRTVKKIEVGESGASGSSDWATFFGIKKEDIEGVDKKEVERQNNLHEIVQSEYKYLNDLKLLKTLYKEGLQKSKIIGPKNLDSFIKNVFGKLGAIQRANEEFLLPQLLYRQKEQGPWVIGFSDIFRDWIRKAKPAYIDYTANFPNAEFLIKQEDRRNLMFHDFLESAQKNPKAQRLAWDHYLRTPITKIQRYSLLLQTVLKNMKLESEEKTNLQQAIAEIQEATRDCNTRLADETRKIQLLDLQARLKLRPEMSKVELNLTQWGRELIYTGDLQRVGNNRFTWLETHAILLDNFLVLAKMISNRDGRSDAYDVSKMPIPMELLMLESSEDDPVVKSSMKGIAAVSAAQGKGAQPQDPRIARTTSQSPRPGLPSPNSNTSLQHVNTTGSTQTMVNTTVLEPSGKDEKTLYPFRLKHLGKEMYTLYAPSAQNRKEWCEKIIEAKTRHAASLFSQNAEPFRLRVVADSAFAYETGTVGQKMLTIKGTPLVRALADVEKRYASSGRPAPICRARVNCSTSFTQPSNGKSMIAVGTDYGVYLSESGNPRGWTRVSPLLIITVVNYFMLI